MSQMRSCCRPDVDCSQLRSRGTFVSVLEIELSNRQPPRTRDSHCLSCPHNRDGVMSEMACSIRHQWAVSKVGGPRRSSPATASSFTCRSKQQAFGQGGPRALSLALAGSWAELFTRTADMEGQGLRGRKFLRRRAGNGGHPTKLGIMRLALPPRSGQRAGTLQATVNDPPQT